MLNDMKLYELEIEDENIDEVFAISMVEAGAIESDWIAFDKEEIAFAKVDTEQRMVIGAILIPNKRIMRIDGEGQPYEVFFSPETIKKLSHNYLMKKYQDKVTLEHDKKIKGVTLVESWIKESKLDKSNNYGLNLPMGTWIGMMKITDEKIWNDYVKTGKTNGFSIEGSFEHRLVAASKDELWASSMLEKIKGIILESYPSLSNPTYSGETPTSGSEFIAPAMFKEGVPHYTAGGKLWEGPTHKDPSGKLMTGETHTEGSKYLYHREAFNFAVVGPRGGIVKSPKAPAGDTPNRNPKGAGTAKGKASGKSAVVSKADEATLQNKVDDFNKKDSNTKNGRATLGQLKSVFQRGLGAFNTSHSPVIKSASAWAFARVNAYLYLLKNGRPENPKYNTDYDLLPKGHPKES